MLFITFAPQIYLTFYKQFKFFTMKKDFTLTLLTALALIGLSMGASAQDTDSATATATIVTPISIAKVNDMNFGNVAVSAATAGTVVMTPAGGTSTTGGVTLPATAGTVSAASFTVSGEGTYTYAITLPTTDYTITHTTTPASTMTVNAFTSTPTGTGALTAGSQTLNVGATLNVDAGETAGTYTNATGFDVTVNYN